MIGDPGQDIPQICSGIKAIELCDRGRSDVAVEPALPALVDADLRPAPGDLPLNFHPAAIRASAVFDTPNGAV